MSLKKKPYPIFTIVSDTSGKTKYNALSPKVGLSFEAAEHQFLYFTFSQGFRSGGISNISSDPSQLPLSSYLPEFSNMFELGWKGTNKERSLQYSLAAFYNHVTNIQTPYLILPDGITITKNAGILNSNGFEWELTSKPLKGLLLQYNGGITNAKYQKFTSVINGMQMSFDNNNQIFTPSHNQFFSSTYEMKINGLETWANFQYILTGKQFFDITNIIEQKTYGLMHAQVGMKFKKFNVYIWGRNLTDKKYFAYGYDFGAVHLGNPRTFGLGISCKIL